MYEIGRRPAAIFGSEFVELGALERRAIVAAAGDQHGADDPLRLVEEVGRLCRL